MDMFASLIIFSLIIVYKEHGVNGNFSSQDSQDTAPSQTSFSKDTTSSLTSILKDTPSSQIVTSQHTTSSQNSLLQDITSSQIIFSQVSTSSQRSILQDIVSSVFKYTATNYVPIAATSLSPSSSFAKFISSSITNQNVDSKIVNSNTTVKATMSMYPMFSSIKSTNVTVTTPRTPPQQRVETRTLVILIVVAVFSVFIFYLIAFGIHGKKRSFNLDTNKKKDHNEFDRLTSVGVPSHYGINVTDNPIKVSEKVKRKEEPDGRDNGSAFDNIALDKKE